MPSNQETYVNDNAIRYINLGDNVWDLREKYEFEKYNDEKKEFYSDVVERTILPNQC